MNLPTFLVVLFGFTGAGVTLIATIVWGIRQVKRLPPGAGQGQISPEELDALRERIADLEQREGRIMELEERLDFMERVLGRSHEAKALPGPADKQVP